MWTSIHDDVALPALALPHVIEDRDAAGRLHDAAEAAAERGAEFGEAQGQTALRERRIFRIVMAVVARRVVARRRFGATRRRFRIVLSAVTRRLFVLARGGRLQHRETIFAIGSGELLRLRRL